jgi:hypothetical protein
MKSSTRSVVQDGGGGYRLADGSEAHVRPDGKVISGISGLAMRQEPDETGKLVTYTDDGPTEERQQQHRAAVMTFKKSRTYRREIRRLRPRTRPARRPHAHGRARRERRHVARATSSSDPGDDGEPDPDAARRVVLGWMAGGAALLDRDARLEQGR